MYDCIDDVDEKPNSGQARSHSSRTENPWRPRSAHIATSASVTIVRFVAATWPIAFRGRRSSPSRFHAFNSRCVRADSVSPPTSSACASATAAIDNFGSAM